MTDREGTRTAGPIAHRCYTERVAAGVDWLPVYAAMATARRIDRAEADLTARGLASFHCPCGGHEAMAAIAPLLTADDWLHLHYRDKALMVARGVAPSAFLHNLLATADSPSAGRQMTPFLGDPERHLLCQNVPVGNHALQSRRRRGGGRRSARPADRRLHDGRRDDPAGRGLRGDRRGRPPAPPRTLPGRGQRPLDLDPDGRPDVLLPARLVRARGRNVRPADPSARRPRPGRPPRGAGADRPVDPGGPPAGARRRLRRSPDQPHQRRR